jgi:ABC-type uncharacterized transport system auxiliary subunit
MQRVLLLAIDFFLILLSMTLIGCAKEMTSKQFETTRKTQTIQLTQEQAAEASASCQYLGDHKAKIAGVTVSHDITLASSKLDRIVAEHGGDSYYIRDSEWIGDRPGEITFYVLFDVYLCDETKP